MLGVAGRVCGGAGSVWRRLWDRPGRRRGLVCRQAKPAWADRPGTLVCALTTHGVAIGRALSRLSRSLRPAPPSSARRPRLGLCEACVVAAQVRGLGHWRARGLVGAKGD